jgi:hypothetical protein
MAEVLGEQFGGAHGPRHVARGARLTLLLSWIVLTRFQSGEINGVDFTVYFDRPCFQTLQGPPAVRRNGGLSEIFAAERIRASRVLGNATRPVACTRSAPLRCVFSPFP